MAFTGTGRDITVKRSAVTGLYDQFEWDDSGNPGFSDNMSHLVLSLLLEYRGQYWADPTGRRGSLLHTVKNDTSTTQQRILSFAREALQPAVNDGRLYSIDVKAERLGQGKYQVSVYWVTPKGARGVTILPLG
jgi:phage gp46-like protein